MCDNNRIEKFHHYMQISILKQRILDIENLILVPNIIHIYGYEHLQHMPGEHWTNCIKNLWKDAGLPSYYVLDLYCDEPFSKRICIHLVSYTVKLYVAKRLRHVVQSQNKDHLILISYLEF